MAGNWTDRMFSAGTAPEVTRFRKQPERAAAFIYSGTPPWLTVDRIAVEKSGGLVRFGCSSWVTGGGQFGTMPLWSKIVGAVAILVASFLAADWIIDRAGLVPAGCPSGETVTFKQPFEKSGAVGYMFQAWLPAGYPFSDDFASFVLGSLRRDVIDRSWLVVPAGKPAFPDTVNRLRLAEPGSRYRKAGETMTTPQGDVFELLAPSARAPCN